jgi:hypothetical protein
VVIAIAAGWDHYLVLRRQIPGTQYRIEDGFGIVSPELEYDARGNVTLEETSGQLTLGFIVLTLPTSATKISYEYTYDSTGNWEKRVKSTWVPDKDSPHWQATSVRYQTIRYYE